MLPPIIGVQASYTIKGMIPVTVDRIVSDREVVTVDALEFEALHLPGHTLSLWHTFSRSMTKRILFSGDVIGTLGWGDFGWDGSVDFDKQRYIRITLQAPRNTL